MKKLFTTIIAGLMVSAQVFAVTPKDVCGQFSGDLWIDWDQYPNRSIYLLPGTTDNTLTFVLPDFTFGNGKLGNIVLPNISMDANGKLTLEETTIWLDSIRLRASIKMLNNYEDEGEIYNSIVSNTAAQVTLEIAEPQTLPMPIIVVFNGNAVRNNNYALNNGGFEGAWTNNEPQGWHSFGSADGLMASFVTANTYQFIQSNEVRPGSKGTNSALLSSNIIFGVKANGNCTNGRINAGSMTADDPANNYNYSDPESTDFNTPFNGRPDSIVFWTKYLPADRDAANAVNKARLNAVITTNARYQDPEATDYSAVKIGNAEINYSATSDMSWQRLAVPFEYVAANKDEKPAYILTTFTTNMTPGGGSSHDKVLDSVYIDDVELVYNNQLKAFTMDGVALTFANNEATVSSSYCDDCVKFGATSNGAAAKAFIAFDATLKCIHVYVIADDFAQTGEYNIYRVNFADTGEQSGVEDVVSNGVRIQKVIIDGQLYIRNGENWYTVMGNSVR